MLRAIKLATKALAIFFVTLFLTRTVFVSGMAQAGVETSAGRSIYLSLRHVFWRSWSRRRRDFDNERGVYHLSDFGRAIELVAFKALVWGYTFAGMIMTCGSV